ncbi:MAG: hypothetical protein D4R67_02855 [Bacteroidetes bacterium]|nr:MAG: hypothetical protein D4R67_02855 [Bacteroidota bacterium]
MTTKEIEALLERYYEGVTTLQEEHSLREYFQRKDVPGHLKEHKELFGFFGFDSKGKVSPGFEVALLEKLQKGRIVRMDPPKKRLVLTLSLAASIVLVAGLVTLVRLGVFNPSQPYGTITDPQLAYAEAKNALYLVSSRLNDGLAQAQQLETFNTGLQKMGKLQSFSTGLDELTKINQLDKYQPIIINPGRKSDTRP